MVALPGLQMPLLLAVAAALPDIQAMVVMPAA
jgi:hypothetical protein